MRINIWIVLVVLIALLAVTRLLRYQQDTQRICADDPSASVCAGELYASRIGALIRAALDLYLGIFSPLAPWSSTAGRFLTGQKKPRRNERGEICSALLHALQDHPGPRNHIVSQALAAHNYPRVRKLRQYSHCGS